MKTVARTEKNKEVLNAALFILTCTFVIASGWIVVDAGAELFFNAVSEFKSQSILYSL